MRLKGSLGPGLARLYAVIVSYLFSFANNLCSIKSGGILYLKKNMLELLCCRGMCCEEAGRPAAGLGLGEHQAWGDGIILET